MGIPIAQAKLDSIEFTVGNTAGGTPIDISQMLVTFTSGTTSEVIQYDKENSVVSGGSGGTPSAPSAGTWAVINTYNNIGDTNHLLEPGEQFVLKIVFPADTTLKPNTPFTVNLQPAVGAVYPIKKTVPPYLNKVNIL